MIFIILTFLTAFSIEALGTLVSVIGLSALFGSNPIIIAFAIALDAGKLIVVSLLYKYWRTLPKMMRAYALSASVITMVVTSAGAAGYLSGEFQKAISGAQESSLKVDVLKQQQAKYEERKRQIDTQIASLPEKTTVNQRIRMMAAFKAEQQDLQAKINQIDQELPKLQVDQIGVNAKAGPILAIAKSFNIPVEQAISYVILTLIIVFDPLAVFLIIAGNFLVEQRKRQLGLDQVLPRPAPVAPEVVTQSPIVEPLQPSQSFVPIEPEPQFESMNATSAKWRDEEPVAQPEPEPEPEPEPVIEEAVIEEPAVGPEPEPEPVIEETVEPVVEEPVEPEPELVVEPEPVVEEPAKVEVAKSERDLITLTTLGLSHDDHPTTSFNDVVPDPSTIVRTTNPIASHRIAAYRSAATDE